MKNCIVWMIFGCLVVAAASLVLPRLGVQVSGGIFFAVLMLACCMGPMLLSGLGWRSGAGCCGTKDAKPRLDGEEPPKPGDGRGGTCH